MPRYARLLALVIPFVLAACGARPTALSPTPTVTVVPFRQPEASPTRMPEATVVPGCEPNDIVEALAPLVPYEEFSLSQNSLEGVRNLNIWFVDPELDPRASGEAIGENVKVARLDAARLAHLLNQGSGCLSTAFEGITALVVDREYNSWFTGYIVPASLPQGEDPSDSDLETAAGTFTVGYLRSSETTSSSRPSAGPEACLWPEARERLLGHFDAGRSNLAFYISIDDGGVNVWGQWDGPPEFDLLQADLLALRAELGCLYPAVDSFWTIYVDGAGTTQLVLAVAGDVLRESPDEDFINQLEIIYPRM